MSRLVTLARKDLRLLARDRMGLFWALGFPLVMALFFGSIFGSGGGKARAIGVAIVDDDRTAGSQAFVERLAASDALAVREDMTLDEARDAVRRGKLAAYVRVGKGYGDTALPFGADAPLEVGLDPSRTAEKGILQGVLVAAAFQGLQQRFRDPASARRLVGDGLASIAPGTTDPQQQVVRKFLGDLDAFLGSVDERTYRRGITLGAEGDAGAGAGGGLGGMMEPRFVEIAHDDTGQPRSAYDISFPSAILWGVLGCASTFALTMMRERLAGTLLRLRAAPLRRWQVLLGKAGACWAACAVVMGLLLLVGRAFLHVRIGSAPFLLLAVAATATCFTGIMMLMSVAGRTLSSASGIAWGSNVVMAMLGGGMIPLAFMPGWMRALSNVSPVKWGILSLEGAIWRDFTAREMALPLLVLVAIGAVAFALGAAIDARREG